MTYFVLDTGDNKIESMSKEQILTAITQAISTGQIQNVDTGFVSTIKEINHQTGLKFWYGTMAEFAALGKKEPNTFYIFSDDTTMQDIEDQFKDQKTFNDYVNIELGNKASQSSVDALSQELGNKASASEVETIKTDVNNLKAKFVYIHYLSISNTSSSSKKFTVRTMIINTSSASITSINNLSLTTSNNFASGYMKGTYTGYVYNIRKATSGGLNFYISNETTKDSQVYEYVPASEITIEDSIVALSV